MNRNGIFWQVIGCLPLVNRLKEVPKEALNEAAAEIGITTIFAAMPFWFPIVGRIFLKEPPSLFDGLTNGELMIYASTLVGPLAYIITKRYGKYITPTGIDDGDSVPLSYPFPNARLCVTVAMVICIIAGVVITLTRIQQTDALKSIQIIDPVGLAVSSVVLFFVSTILLFCVSAYRNFIEHMAQTDSTRISRAQANDEEALAAAWRAARDGEA